MKLIKGKEKAYKHCQKINDNSVGQAILRYAERVADLLETEIDNSNKTPKEVIAQYAEEKLDEADVDEITGAMCDFALTVLYDFWKYGAYLEEWMDSKVKHEHYE